MGSTVKFGRFKADKAGYAALMNSGPVQGAVSRPARSVLSAANAALGKDGYRLPGFEVRPFQGKLAHGFVVRTKTDHARYSQAKRKTLTKALRAAKG